MRVRRELPEQLTTAWVNDCAVAVHQTHRRRADRGCVPGPGGSVLHESVLAVVSAPIGLSVEDVTAVLFDWDWPAEDLDDDRLRELIAETVVNSGCFHLDQLRCDLANQTLDPEASAYLAYCHQRATAVFGPGPAPGPGPGRVPAGVR